MRTGLRSWAMVEDELSTDECQIRSGQVCVDNNVHETTMKLQSLVVRTEHAQVTSCIVRRYSEMSKHVDSAAARHWRLSDCRIVVGGQRDITAPSLTCFGHCSHHQGLRARNPVHHQTLEPGSVPTRQSVRDEYTDVSVGLRYQNQVRRRGLADLRAMAYCYAAVGKLIRLGRTETSSNAGVPPGKQALAGVGGPPKSLLGQMTLGTQPKPGEVPCQMTPTAIANKRIGKS